MPPEVGQGRISDRAGRHGIIEPVTSHLPAAVLWDMDGTLVDTEPLWIASERALVERHGGTWSDADSLALVGSDLLAAGEYIRTRGNVPMTAAEIVDHMIGEVLEGVRQHVEWRPGVPELLAELRQAGVPCAMVTMSYRVLAQAIADRLPAGTFVTLVTGDSVTHGKPHPEPYLAGAAAIGVDPAACVVIEDSATGVRSGLAAGAQVIGVPNVVALDAQPGLVVLDSLAGVGAADLLALFDESRLDPV